MANLCCCLGVILLVLAHQLVYGQNFSESSNATATKSILASISTATFGSSSTASIDSSLAVQPVTSLSSEFGSTNSTGSNASESIVTPTGIASTISIILGSETGKPPTVSDFDCMGLEPGYYGNKKEACSRKFYICVEQSLFAYEEQCPARLYYDPEMKICNSWAHVPVCSGRPRPTAETWNQTAFSAEPIVPVVGCYNLTDGNYPDPLSTPKPFCSRRFFTCVGQREFAFFCPAGLFYDRERNECDLYQRVFACSGIRVSNDTDRITWGPPLPPINFDCKGKSDGYYVEKCDSVYYNCNGGTASEFHCPDGLVFDSNWLACESPSNTYICTGSRRPSTAHPSTLASVGTTTPSPLNCGGRADGIYRDPTMTCSRVFYYCAHAVTFRNYCPGNLYYDDELKRCDLWINVFACSGFRPTTTSAHSTSSPPAPRIVDFDCSKSDDGNFVNPKNKCSQFYYICANMEATQQYCPSGLYYDPDFNTCDLWANIVVCTGSPKPTVATLGTPGSTQKPEFDCSSRSDGVYFKAVNACADVYFRCNGGVSFKFFCPGGLFYDATVDRCDVYDNVFACSGRTAPSSVSTPSSTTGTTLKPPIDCRPLPDGDYADSSAQSNCSRNFYTCSSGTAIRRECADGTYFDPELRVCDKHWNVPICSGKTRFISATSPSTVHTTGSPLAFDCTKLFDGNYPNGSCSGDYWSCVGGTTFQRRCPVGFVYDDETNECEYPQLVPKCGGNRLISPTYKPVVTNLPVGGFVCTFRLEGNYVDPEAVDGCSTIYYTCANGITTRVHCPGGLYYDGIGNLCNSHDKVPACMNSSSTAPSSSTASSFVSSTSTVVSSSSVGPSGNQSTESSIANASLVSSTAHVPSSAIAIGSVSQSLQPIFNSSSSVWTTEIASTPTNVTIASDSTWTTENASTPLGVSVTEPTAALIGNVSTSESPLAVETTRQSNIQTNSTSEFVSSTIANISESTTATELSTLRIQPTGADLSNSSSIQPTGVDLAVNSSSSSAPTLPEQSSTLVANFSESIQSTLISGSTQLVSNTTESAASTTTKIVTVTPTVAALETSQSQTSAQTSGVNSTSPTEDITNF